MGFGSTVPPPYTRCALRAAAHLLHLPPPVREAVTAAAAELAPPSDATALCRAALAVTCGASAVDVEQCRLLGNALLGAGLIVDAMGAYAVGMCVRDLGVAAAVKRVEVVHALLARGSDGISDLDVGGAG